ncbi:MAG: EAL domain-containing protein [Salinarimonas sp.]|nr:EAL domain-containing protein [Salinarimonas sp.]
MEYLKLPEFLEQDFRSYNATKVGRNAPPEWHDELHRLATELAAYKSALDQHAIVAVTDRRGVIRAVNEPFCRISGYTRDELLGKTHAILNSGQHGKEFFQAMWRTIASNNVWRGEICNRAKDGHLYWVDSTIAPIADSDERIEGYVAIRFDITERKQSEAAREAEAKARHRAESLIRDVMAAIPDGVAAFDADDRLTLWNDGFLQTYPLVASKVREGITFEEFLREGVERGEFLPAGTSPVAKEAFIQKALRDHRNPGTPVQRKNSDGRWVQVRENRTCSGHIVGVRSDITELKAAEERLRRQAETDALTGLVNRKVLLRRLNSTLVARRRDGERGALAFLDLDNLKIINDIHGHDIGDSVIKTLAERVSAEVDKNATLARVGGDEFALLWPRLSGEEEAIARCEELLLLLDRPMRVLGKSIAPRCSIGLAVFPDADHGAKDILKHADIALYEAKASRRGSVRVFAREMRQKIERRRKLADQLAVALLADDIDVVLQPQVRINTMQHEGFEALLRWNCRGEAIAPQEIVSIAEENQLGIQLGDAVITRACRVHGKMKALGFKPGTLAINVTTAQLRDEEFSSRLIQLAGEAGLEPCDICIEITETTLLDRALEIITANLDALHQQGVSIALDDFGTGYASLTHLKSFPVDMLKIDRSFIMHMTPDSDDAMVTEAMINLARALGINAVAEGVETSEQYAMLRQMGCDYAQGYLVSRPIPPSGLAGYLAATTKSEYLF